MKSFLGGSAIVAAFAAATIAACGGSKNDQAKNPEPRAMNELTPAEQQQATQRAEQQQERERQRELAAATEPHPQNAPSVTRTSTALAASSIATARCDRELKCKNIGPNKNYLSTDECVTKLQNDKRTDINPQDCPQGVNDKELANCLKAIRNEDCGNPLDHISRLTACRSGAMCLK